jgi:hypothetical protein
MNKAIEVFSVSLSPEALDTPTFLLSDVAAAAEVNTNVLKAWLDREVVPLGANDRPALGRGSGRVFTLRRVFSIAIMAELTRMGITPSRASALAFMVTDNTVSVPGVELSLRTASEGGYLIVSAGEEAGESHFDFIPARSKVPVAEIMGARRSMAVISFSALFGRVFEALVRRGKWPQ